ncbi:hypothetical protein [Sporolactobacillus nakayamae]|nr:hypothetical protein [Sporolactobacillus nakayamae]
MLELGIVKERWLFIMDKKMIDSRNKEILRMVEEYPDGTIKVVNEA